MAWLWRQNLWMWSQQTCSNCAMLSSQYGTKSLRSVSGTVCESVLQPVETLGLKQMSVFPIRSLSHSEHRSCRVTRVWINSGVVAVQGEDIYCRIPNTTDACYQVEVVFWLIPVIQTGWKLTCMSHTCAHTCSPPRTRTHTHSRTLRG